jgi:hypothetical protein
MARLTDKTTATAVTLNSLVHIVNTGDTSQSSSGSSYKTNLGQVADVIGGYQYYSAVTISSADILTLSSVPVELLPAPGVGNYYDTKFIIEYTFNTTPYASLGSVIITDGVNTSYDVFALSLFGADTIFIVQSMIGPIGTGISTNNPLYLTNQTANPTSGDGDLLVKIWYSIRTVG